MAYWFDAPYFLQLEVGENRVHLLYHRYVNRYSLLPATQNKKISRPGGRLIFSFGSGVFLTAIDHEFTEKKFEDKVGDHSGR